MTGAGSQCGEVRVWRAKQKQQNKVRSPFKPEAVVSKFTEKNQRDLKLVTSSSTRKNL
jgi:hypothetical protein